MRDEANEQAPFMNGGGSEVEYGYPVYCKRQGFYRAQAPGHQVLTDHEN